LEPKGVAAERGGTRNQARSGPETGQRREAKHGRNAHADRAAEPKHGLAYTRTGPRTPSTVRAEMGRRRGTEHGAGWGGGWDAK